MGLLTDRRRCRAPRLWALLLVGALLPLPAAAWQAGSGEDLRAAAGSGDIGAVRDLLARGVPVDDANEYGATALMLAALHGRGAVVRALLEAGADTGREDSFYGRSPLAWANWGGHQDIVTELTIGGSGDFGVLFMQAVESGDAEAVARLLAAKVPELEVLNEALKTAIATRNDALERLLMGYGAVPPPVEFVAVRADTLRMYEGRYSDETGYELIVLAETNTLALLVRAPELRDPLRFRPIHPRRFVAEHNTRISLRFEVRDGRVVSMAFAEGNAVRQMAPQ